MIAASPASRRLRVLHCVSRLALGGAEQIALTLAEALRADIDTGFYAVRGVDAGAMGRALRLRIDALRAPLFVGAHVPMRFGGMLTGAWGLARAIRRFSPDVIHLHTETPEASYAALVALRPAYRRIPVVRTIHNSVYWEFSRSLGCGCDRRMARSHCAAVSADALAALRRLRSASQAGAFAAEPSVIYNAVAAIPQRSAAAGPRDAPLRVLFGGRFEKEKGADLLPAILARTRPPAGGSASLSLFGEGSLAPALRQFAAAPPQGWRVDIHPPSPDFREHLHHYDLVIVPSRFEGLGLVAIEAISAGVPVVVTDAPGLRETVPDHYEWTATAGDPVGIAATLRRALSASPETRHLVAERARQHVQNRFSLARMAQDYRTLYTRAASV
jgi:glycosyltransferase involved in cell wall biosynthesis